MSYRSTWSWVVVLMAAGGIWLALKMFPLAGVVLMFLYALLVVGLMAAMIEQERPRHIRRAFTIGAGSGAVLIASIGVVGLLGKVGVVGLGMLAVFSPPVVSWMAARSHGAETRTVDLRPSGDRGAAVDPDVVSVAELALMTRPLESMDDVNLCMAWRATYVMLQRHPSLRARARIVQRRQEYLDELELRNPDGFSAWLASGPRAAGDPSRYLAANRHVRHDGGSI